MISYKYFTCVWFLDVISFLRTGCFYPIFFCIKCRLIPLLDLYANFILFPSETMSYYKSNCFLVKSKEALNLFMQVDNNVYLEVQEGVSE